MAVSVATLPAEDSASGLGLKQVLCDPLVYMAAIPVVFVAGLAGWLIAYSLLVRTRLCWTIPITMSCTFVGTAIGALVNVLVAALLGFVAGVAAMYCCKHLLPLSESSDCAT
jgi:hypothetical protein